MLEGHTALRVITPDGRDLAVNWGMFNFSDPGFAIKFAKGETDYWVAAEPTPWFINQYSASGRRVEERSLNLSPQQANRLYELVVDNLKPENAVYRYRYLTDNCATRPLDLIERAVLDCGDSLSFPLVEGQTTWRNELRGYHARHPLYQLFIDIALGAGVDCQISPREQAFAPLFLDKLVAETNVVYHDGVSAPLAASELRVLSRGIEDIAGSEPSPWVVIAPILILSIVVALCEIKRHKIIKWFNALIFFVFGVIGVVVSFLVFFSSQEATGSNINILWLNPLPLLVPILIWSRKTRQVVNIWMWLNFATLAVFLLGQPFLRQSPGGALLAMAVIDLILTASYIFVSGGFARLLKEKAK